MLQTLDFCRVVLAKPPPMSTAVIGVRTQGTASDEKTGLLGVNRRREDGRRQVATIEHMG